MNRCRWTKPLPRLDGRLWCSSLPGCSVVGALRSTCGSIIVLFFFLFFLVVVLANSVLLNRQNENEFKDSAMEMTHRIEIF